MNYLHQQELNLQYCPFGIFPASAPPFSPAKAWRGPAAFSMHHIMSIQLLIPTPIGLTTGCCLDE